MKKYFFMLIVFSFPLFAQESPHGILREECTNCHTTNGWHVLTNPMKFDHNSTSFVLYGQHRNTECRNCHKNLKFIGTPRTCVSCHKKEYDAAIVLNHMNAAFGFDCAECHSISASSWQGSFDHDKTQFPTRGAHEGVACNTCHVNNLFRGTPTQCIACHQNEFNTTKDPSHTAAGFSTDCATCHRALTWQPAALFPHDGYFPISSGSHHSPGRWNSCKDCHKINGQYTSYSCTTGCHQTAHNQGKDCYHCHPQG